MTVRLPASMTNTTSSEAYTIDFREVAPLAAHEKMYVGQPDAARWGGLSVGVPGELRGLQKAHELWGTVPWKDLVAPVAELAKGWIVQKELERRIEVRFILCVCQLSTKTGARRCFLQSCSTPPTGRPYSPPRAASFVKATSSNEQHLRVRWRRLPSMDQMRSIRSA